MPQNEKPVYLAPADEQFISEYDDLFNQFADNDEKTLEITLHTDLVYRGEAGRVQQMILALQHRPELIEKMLFSLNIKFTLIENSDLFIPESYWKKDAIYYRWFHQVAASPVMLFFLKDEDARFYALAGDMLAVNLFPIEPGAWKRNKMVGLEEEQLEEIANRLFTSCWMMLIYCHGSGFNPEPYIKNLLAELDLPVTFEEVYEKYRRDIESEINFRIRNVA